MWLHNSPKTITVIIRFMGDNLLITFFNSGNLFSKMKGSFKISHFNQMWMALWYQVTPFVQIIFNDFICFIASTSQYQLGGNDISGKTLTF